MTFLPDDAVDRLRRAAGEPDLSATKYELIQFLAEGGMSNVYMVRDRDLDRRVALKVIDITDTEGEAAPRLLREARVIAKIEHPGIVPVHDAGRLPDGRAFYVMKLVEGKTLADYCKDQPALRDALRIYQKICDAAAFAHSRGVIHRDLKPSNIMIGPFGEAVVLDWGVARELYETAAGSQNTTKIGGAAAGTPGYMSPEQERGELDKINARSDVYQLGIILKYIVNGLSFNIKKNERRRLSAIYLKAAAAEQGDRYENAGALAADVARFMDGFPITAYRESILERAALFASRNVALIALVAAYLVMRIIIFSWIQK